MSREVTDRVVDWLQGEVKQLLHAKLHEKLNRALSSLLSYHYLMPWAWPRVWAARGAGAAQWAEVGPVARMYVTVTASGMPGGSGERGRGGGW